MQNNAAEFSPRATRKRQAIMDAAWQVFSSQGYERTTVEAIVALAGGSKSTVYSYFQSKEDLFLQASLTRAAELSLPAFEEFPSQSNPARALYVFGVNYLRFYLNSDLIEVFRLAAAEARKLSFGKELYDKNFRTSWGKVARYLEEHLEKERLLPGGGWTAAMHLRGLLDGDTLMRHSWGIMDEQSPEVYERMAHTAVTAFLRIYAPDRIPDIPKSKRDKRN